MVEVPARCVIGVDLGGTKLLAGAVDPERLTVHHRARREAFGLDQSALIEAVVDAVEEASAAVDGEVEAVGFGIPCTFDRRTGIAVQAVNLPLADLHFGDLMSERLGLPVEVDNDANCAVWAEARAGAARGATDVAMLTIGTGIGGGLVLGGRLYRGWVGRGGRARPHGRRHRRAAVPGQLPELGLPRGGRLRHARSCARRRCAWRASPTRRSAARSRTAAR